MLSTISGKKDCEVVDARLRSSLAAWRSSGVVRALVLPELLRTRGRKCAVYPKALSLSIPRKLNSARAYKSVDVRGEKSMSCSLDMLESDARLTVTFRHQASTQATFTITSVAEPTPPRGQSRDVLPDFTIRIRPCLLN
jgi:hypothetical protein